MTRNPRHPDEHPGSVTSASISARKDIRIIALVILVLLIFLGIYLAGGSRRSTPVRNTSPVTTPRNQ